MFSAYIFCLVVGGGMLAFSLFGDLFGADGEMGAGTEPGVGDGGDFAKLFSLRALVYALFGFGAGGAVLHLLWGGSRPGLVMLVAAVTGLVTGVSAGAAFRYLRRSSSGAMRGEESFVGLTGEVLLDITFESPGTVRIVRGARRHNVRARPGPGCLPDQVLTPGQAVVVAGMRSGIAEVVPVDKKLLEE